MAAYKAGRLRLPNRRVSLLACIVMRRHARAIDRRISPGKQSQQAGGHIGWSQLTQVTHYTDEKNAIAKGGMS
jgi:hypothetical protein